MKTRVAILLVAGMVFLRPAGIAQNSEPPTRPADQPAAAPKPAETKPAEATKPANPENAEETLDIIFQDPPIEIIKVLCDQAKLEVQIDPKIQNGQDAAGNPIPKWSEAVSKRWEKKTPRQALEAFLAEYGMALVQDEPNKTLRITYRTTQETAPTATAVKPVEGQPEAKAEPKPQGGKAAEGKAGVLSADEPTEWNIENMTVLEAIAYVGDRGHMNLFIDPRVTAGIDPEGMKVSQFLTNTIAPQHWGNLTPRQAMETLLAGYSLQMTQSPTSHVATVTYKPAKEPMMTKVVRVKYANPTNMVALLTSSLPADSKVKEDIRTSSLLITTTAKGFDTVQAILEQLDTPTRQVLIEAQILETQKNPKSLKGVDWTDTLSAQKVSFGSGIKQTTTTQSQPTTVPGPGGRPVTVPGTASEQTSYLFNRAAPGVVPTPDQGFNPLLLSTASGLNPNFGFLNAQGLRAALSFLNTDLDTRTLATPRAVTVDNQETKLEVSTAIPIFDSSETIGQAGTSVSSTKPNYTNVGTILIVTPRISGTNVALNIRPEISDVVEISHKVVAGKVNEAEIFGQSKIQTQVIIPSGNTLVMGGLIRERTSKGYTKVPLLGDMPLLGWAFRSQSKQRLRYNLLIFVTPTIIESTDFQPAKTEFFKTPKPEYDPSPESFMDSGKPANFKKQPAPAKPSN